MSQILSCSFCEIIPSKPSSSITLSFSFKGFSFGILPAGISFRFSCADREPTKHCTCWSAITSNLSIASFVSHLQSSDRPWSNSGASRIDFFFLLRSTSMLAPWRSRFRIKKSTTSICQMYPPQPIRRQKSSGVSPSSLSLS